MKETEMNEDVLDPQLVYKLSKALQRNQVGSDVLSYIADGNRMKEIGKLQSGDAKIVNNYCIDCNANLDVPEPYPYRVKEHRLHERGTLEWLAGNVSLYQTRAQKNGESIDGHTLRERLRREPVCNFNVLIHLVSHTEIIPVRWMSRQIFFWGTIFQGEDERMFVPVLIWRGDFSHGLWMCHFHSFDEEIPRNGFALLDTS